jgi:hypothetical protein
VSTGKRERAEDVEPAAQRARLALQASYRAEQGVGFHPVASGSFLKSELVV